MSASLTAGDRPNTRSGRRLQVALVNMPFGSTRYPSIQLGLLQAILAQRDITASTHYLNLRFAARIGWEPYEVLCQQRCHLLGEWIFSRAAFGEDTADGEHYLGAYARELDEVCAALGRDTQYLLSLRDHEAPAFIEECLEALPWDEVDVVGFGSVFEQNCAALALARRIKERYPHVITVFGGANLEDEMGLEYVRGLPWIDYAVIGEGDHVFPELLERLAEGEDGAGLAGVARRAGDGVCFTGRAPMTPDLDALPDPDYHDYFTAAAELKLPGTVQGRGVLMPFESARGCWWGQKHHCTFCGLNGLGMAYRSKSPARVLAGVDELARRHHVYSFEAVDNIMDHRYIDDVFGPLGEQRRDYTFFYEVKANLTPAQLRTMARGGVRRIQPGIESLSTHVLRLMRKGTTAIQNVRLLKWAEYYGIGVGWNLLYGFPGEQVEDYERQLAIMRLIPHLPPPNGAGRIWLERFSPYFTEAAERGIRAVRPERAYACIYPADLDHERIAYFFEYEAADTLPPETYQPVLDQVSAWQQARTASRRPYLGYLRGSGRLTVMDGRDPGTPRAHVFDEPAALIYDFCGPTAHGAAQILAHLRDVHAIAAGAATVQRDLDTFTALGLMLEEDGHYLSLALPANPNW